MLAVRGSRPFSLAQKLHDLDSYLPQGRTICEIRLLAVEKRFRGGQVLRGLLALLWQLSVEKGYDLGIISGTTRQLRLYRHLGFVPFGPLVGSGAAQFQPMYVKMEAFEVAAREFLRTSFARSSSPGAVNLLPGPVTVRAEVRRAFEQAPESHRSNDFKKDFQTVKQMLCDLVHVRNVEVFMGSGTLANDVIAGQLSRLGRPGLVLSNGEFGSRLVDHARRFRLEFETMEFAEDGPLDLAAIEKKLASGADWLWCVHCETSSGVLNDIAALQVLCARTRTKLCLDCVSTIGNVPVHLSGVYLASGSSGKGLRAYPGLAMVFYQHKAVPAPEWLPRCLDLGYYAQEAGIPFTFSSNLLNALHFAIRQTDLERRFQQIIELSAELRRRLAAADFVLVGTGALVSPAVVTIALPPELNSSLVGEAMQRAGYLLSYNSGYLLRKNRIQICLMGEVPSERILPFAKTLKDICSRISPVSMHGELIESSR